MTVLVVHHSGRESIMNLDSVVKIEYDPNESALLFWTDASVPFRFWLAPHREDVMTAVLMALKPIYDGRSMYTHGVRCDLDLTLFEATT